MVLEIPQMQRPQSPLHSNDWLCVEQREHGVRMIKTQISSMMIKW